MKRKTSNRFQGDFFSALVPVTNATAAATGGTDTDVQPREDFKDLRKKTIEQVSTVNALPEPEVEPVCGTSERIDARKALAAHFSEAEPAAGAVSRVDLLAAHSIGGTATATGSIFTSVIPESGQDQCGNDDLFGRARTSATRDTRVGAAATGKVTRIHAGDLGTPTLSGTPGHVRIEPSRMVRGDIDAGSGWSMPAAETENDTALGHHQNSEVPRTSAFSAEPAHGGQASAGGCPGLSDDYGAGGSAFDSKTTRMSPGSGAADSTATGSKDDVSRPRGAAPGVPGTPGNVARDRVGRDQVRSATEGEGLDDEAVKHPVQGHPGTGESGKKKESCSVTLAGVPVAAEAALEDGTGSASGCHGQLSGEPSKQITMPTPAPANEGPEGVVNDSKAELFEETFVDSADVDGGYVPEEVKSSGLLPQGLTMKSIDFSKYAVCAEKQGDRQPLRDAVRIMDHHRLTPHEFAGLSEAAMVLRVEQYACSTIYGSIAATMANPKRLVRQIRYGLARLSRQFPDAGLPVTAEPEDRCLHPLPLSLQVGLLGRQVKSWNPRLLGVEDPTATGGVMKYQTKLDYILKVWILANICRNAEVDINEEIGIGDLIRPDVVDIWLPAAAEHYSKTTIAPFISAIRRIAADILSDEYPDVANLREHVGKYFATLGITKEQADEARRLASSDGAEAGTIWTMAQAMQARARGPGRLSAADRDGRESRATAAEILVSNPALQPETLAKLHLDHHIKGSGYTRKILVRIAGKEDWQPMTRDACERLDQLLAFRESSGRTCPFLFRAKCGTKPQQRRVAMNGLITDMSAVLRRPVRPTQIKDAVRIKNFERTPEFIMEISEATGLMSARSAERRYAIIFDRPDPPEESGEHP